MGPQSFRAVFEGALPHEREAGSRAYAMYRRLVGHTAQEQGFPLEVGLAVMAALSPNNRLLTNLQDTRRLLSAARAKESIDSFLVRTYTANKRKAWRLAHGANPLHLLLYPKTRNFFLNMLDPEDPYPVTIDGHMINVWFGTRQALHLSANRRAAPRYNTLATALREIAQDAGLVANQVQATIWLAWRRMHRIEGHQPQLELWSSEARAAGVVELGFTPTWPVDSR